MADISKMASLEPVQVLILFLIVKQWLWRRARFKILKQITLDKEATVTMKQLIDEGTISKSIWDDEPCAQLTTNTASIEKR